MTVGDLEAASERVGERRGWDFSKIRAVRDETPWDYEALVSALASGRPTPTPAVLDIGTGGGEVLSRLIGITGWHDVVAVDHSQSMIEVAAPALAEKARVVAGDAKALPFASGSFDIVLERHAAVHPSEVSRVLRSGGLFVTQQVGAHNTQSIFDAFEWGSNWEQFANDDPPPRRCAELAIEFEQLGYTVERLDEAHTGYAFEDLDSLVFFLKAAPMPEELEPARHVDAVNRLLATNLSSRGIETTEHRELLVVRAP